MFRNLRISVFALLAVAVAPAQDRRPQIDVEQYQIEAEVNPATQSLTARAQVRFQAQEARASSAVFELNNALNLSKVEDETGQQLPASRNAGNHTITVNFPEPLPQGQPKTVTFYYDGRLTGSEESPVWGIKFAAIHNDFSYLMYPSRWFPVSGYTTDRFTSELKITVPAGATVVAAGLEQKGQDASGKPVYTYKFDQPSFPGSFAVVTGEPARVSASGVTTALHFRGEQQPLADAYGQEFGKAMAHFTSVYGLPPQANLTVVQTEEGAPNGYSAPGVVFLSPQAIAEPVNFRVVANQTARQWWGMMLSGATRGNLWITNGAARYAELLYNESVNGPSALESEIRDVYVDALTVDDVPVAQASRIEDYSPEFWALTSSKGAAVMHMLRYVMGEDAFKTLLKEFPGKFAWKSVSTDDFAQAASNAAGQDLKYFFLQWIESSGAPEFQLEYTIFRTQKGFRVMGKVAQDLDTFRMPVDLKITTEGNPEEKRVEVVGTSSEFVVETFGKPRKLDLDPANRVLRFNDNMRVAVAIRRGEQFAEIGEFNEALKEYQRALEVNRNSSLAHYRIAEVFFLQNNYQAAANEFREALNGDLEPKWTEVWAHINLGKIFDITGQRERAVNEYELAMRTKDNTQGALEEAAKYRKAPYERQKKSIG